MNYGSRNAEDELEFIRRVVAPPKRNGNSRRKQKRMAAVGGAVALLAVGATVAYVAMPSNSGASVVSTETLSANVAQGFVIPDEDEAEEDAVAAAPTGSTATVPKFSDYDIDGDGSLSLNDFRTRLDMNRDHALDRVAGTGYFDSDEKADLVAQIKKNYATEYSCIAGLAESAETITDDNFAMFYSLMEFCQTEVTIRTKRAEAEAAEAAAAAAAAAAGALGEPVKSVVVDTPSGPVVLDIPPIVENQPTQAVVIDTPSGPTVVVIPVVPEGVPTTTVTVDTPSGPIHIELPIENLPPASTGSTSIADIIDELGGFDLTPAITVIVDTPTGPTTLEIPEIKVDEPSTTIVVDTPTGVTVLELPIAQPDEPSTTIVVDTPTGPVAIDVPLEAPETSAPATSVVVDTPSGPAVLDIPPVVDNEPSTTIVVDTPTGVTVLELPIAQPDEPSTTIVVDTPTGPVVVEIPAAPIVTPIDLVAKKQAFLVKIASHFDAKHMVLNQKLAAAQDEVAALATAKDLLEKCIIQAADKFGELEADNDELFEMAVNWVENSCRGA